MRSEVLTGFGHPDTLVYEHAHWFVLVAKRQMTLGTLLIVERSGVTTLGAVSDASWRELPTVIRDIEAVLARCFAHDRMNVLFLMMATPEVHAAIIPRYAGPREFSGMTFTDQGWPRAPVLDAAHTIDDTQSMALMATLREAFVTIRQPAALSLDGVGAVDTLNEGTNGVR